MKKFWQILQLLKFCSKFEEGNSFFAVHRVFCYSSCIVVLGLGMKKLDMPVVSSVLTYAAFASSHTFDNVDSALQDHDEGNKFNFRFLW